MCIGTCLVEGQKSSVCPSEPLLNTVLHFELHYYKTKWQDLQLNPQFCATDWITSKSRTSINISWSLWITSCDFTELKLFSDWCGELGKFLFQPPPPFGTQLCCWVLWPLFDAIQFHKGLAQQSVTKLWFLSDCLKPACSQQILWPHFIQFILSPIRIFDTAGVIYCVHILPLKSPL
jgi:hypothetical protein